MADNDKSSKRIEVAIRAAQTARSVLDLMTAKNRATSSIMWMQIMNDLEGLQKSVKEAFPE